MPSGSPGRYLVESSSSVSHAEQRVHEWVAQQNSEQHATISEYINQLSKDLAWGTECVPRSQDL